MIIVLLLIIAVIVGVEIFIYKKHAFDKINVDVRFSQSIANCGDTIEVVEKAENAKKLPLPFLILKFEVPSELEFKDSQKVSVSDLLYREDMLTMRPFSRHTRKIKLLCSHRGYFDFARVSASTADLFLFSRFSKDFTPNSNVTVLPEIIPTDDLQMLTKVTFSDTPTRRSLLMDPFSFAGIREYQPWDPMNSINWTASAKAGDFMVNQNISTTHQNINIFLNLEYYNNKKSVSLLEYSISLVYSYMNMLSANNISFTFCCNGIDILSSTALEASEVSGSGNIISQGINLARLDLNQPAVPFKNLLGMVQLRADSDDLNIIISPNFDAEFQNTLSDLASHNIPFTWIMPCYKYEVKTKNIDLNEDIAESFIRQEINGHD